MTDDRDRQVSTFDDILFSQTPQRPLGVDIRVPQWVEKAAAGDVQSDGGDAVVQESDRSGGLTEHGFAMASIDCRVSSEAIAPAAVHDCQSAASDGCERHADDYGYRADSIGTWGHSAGGLLAALMATSGDVAELEGDGPHLDISSRIQAACDECGAPQDLAYFADPGVQSRFAAPVTENLRLYFGGPVEQRRKLARLVSPRTYVSLETAPLLLIHGDADKIVPVEETIEFYEALKPLSDATLRVLPGIGHSWNVELTRDDIVSFFRRTLMRILRTSGDADRRQANPADFPA